jgi:carbon-monoxide dehydrogenase large subunit
MESGEESPVPLFGLQPIIARDRVRYVGEPVAIVIATDPSVAESAAEQVYLDIDELDPVLDAEEALAGDILIHAGGTNVTLDMEIGDGDVEAFFAGADLVVSERFYEHRHGATPLETRGLIAEVGDDGRLTVWGPAKVKHFNLTAIASVLGLAPERVRFIEPDVGGAFGARGELYPEDYLIPWAAMRLGPAREVDRGPGRVADRAQPLPGADDRPRGRRPAADGRLLAFRARNLCNMGAYMRTNGVVPPMLCALSLHGPYRWGGFHARAIGVLTNKTPLGTFRGPGEVEATFARERMLDLVAARSRSTRSSCAGAT